MTIDAKMIADTPKPWQRSTPAPFGNNVINRPMSAFAEGGEDVCMSNFFKYPMPGVYVDVGCNHPTICSNTALFYHLGFRGVCIDANPLFAEEFKKARPEDLFIASGVAAQPGTLTFHNFTGFNRVSTFDRAAADGMARMGFGAYEEVQIPVRRLNDILDEAGVRHIDILSIDIEHMDAEVIESFDFTRWCPRLIAIEDGLDMTDPTGNRVYRCLTAAGYLLEARPLQTSIYIYPRNDAERERQVAARNRL
jgi:FkbM family methyltransferase